MIQLPESILTQLLTDPVMAARVLLGWEMDHYQAAGLRYDWWYPETIDDSAVSTGKTLRVFIFANLRATLIPNQRIGIYFPNFQTAKEEFWPYFDETIGKSDFYAQQLRPGHGKLGESKMQGAWLMDFKNGSRISVPAPGHATDGSNQATRRFNTLIVDDWRRCEEMGDSIAKQLIDRVTRPSFNPEHPIWGNHIHFKGHAESPSHKSHWRVQRFRRQITDGSTRHAIYTFCYRDVGKGKRSDGTRWRKLIRPDHTIRTQRTQLPPDQYQRQWLGIVVRGGKSYYPEGTLARCCVVWVFPILRRAEPEWHYFLGQDVAPGQTVKADYSSSFVWGAREVPADMTIDGRRVEATWVHPDFGRWQIAAFYAYTLKNRSAGETSAFMHWLHDRFGFSGIVLDPGGGGLWIYKELRKAKQSWPELGWMERDVVPLCTPDEPASADKQPIVQFIKRGGGFDHLSFVHRNTLVSDDGFLFALHQRYQEAWHARELAWPPGLEERSPELLRTWEPDQIEAQRTLDKGLLQLSRVRQITDSTGRPLTSKRGFPLFAAQGKKDIAYSGWYGWLGLMRWIEGHRGAAELEAEVCSSF